MARVLLQPLLDAVDEVQASAGLAEAINPLLGFDVESVRQKALYLANQLRSALWSRDDAARTPALIRTVADFLANSGRQEQQQIWEQRDATVAALTALAHEVTAILGMAEGEMRDVAGNTNVAVLIQRRDEAFAALTKERQS